jgi:hypothetical protein
MSINALLSTIILISFIVTLILAVGSYMAYKIRERRRPPAIRFGDGDEPVFFERFFPSRGPEAAVVETEDRGA